MDLVHVPASELVKKCRYREDIINICRELGNIYKLYFFLWDFIFKGREVLVENFSWVGKKWVGVVCKFIVIASR